MTEDQEVELLIELSTLLTDVLYMNDEFSAVLHGEIERKDLFPMLEIKLKYRPQSLALIRAISCLKQLESGY
jgi:hypothetical protein